MAEDDVKEENVADIDFSQIRTSIQIGGRVIEQVLNSVHYGSPEVRCLLLDECDLILECRVCRGLFRALPNFVAHKRVYCKQAYVMTQDNVFGTVTEEDIVVVEPTAPEETSEGTSTHFSSENMSAYERVANTIEEINHGKLGKSEMYKLYAKAADKVNKQKKSKKSLDLVLTKIASNPNAVKVSYQNHTEVDEIKSVTNIKQKVVQYRVDPITNIAREDCTYLSKPVSKEQTKSEKPVSKIHKYQIPTEESVFHHKTEVNDNSMVQDWNCNTNGSKRKFKNCDIKLTEQDIDEKFTQNNILDLSSLKCLQCNTRYSSRKTLLYHFQMQHSGLRTFFPCPFCSSVFFYFWGLTRHIRVSHRKTPNQINKMRKKLREAAFTKNVSKSCIQAKGQLDYKTEIKSSAENTKTSKGKELGSSVRSAGKDINISCNETDISCKAIVKHTSRHAKHTFACRYVPQNMSLETDVLDKEKNFVSQEKPDRPKRYNHRLSCDICKKVFWKKSRLLNHKKFCSSTGNIFVSCIKYSLRKPACAFCRTIFQKKGHLERHAELCRRKKETEEKTEKVHKGKDFTAVSVSLFSCSSCDRSFAKKISLENHKRSCKKNTCIDISTIQPSSCTSYSEQHKSVACESEMAQNRSFRTSLNGDKKDDMKNDHTCMIESLAAKKDGIQELKAILKHEKLEESSEKVKSKYIFVEECDVSGKLHCQDSRKLSGLMNETEMKCKKCGQSFTSVFNLRRHAVRHLGWKRFKCKLCCFSSYNKPECDMHIATTHSEKYHCTSAGILIDTYKGVSRIQTNLRTPTSRKLLNNGKKLLLKKCDSKMLKTIDPMRKFNISTRNSPRKFDTRPYQKLDSMSTLFTRKGYYPKQRAHFEKLTDCLKIKDLEGNESDISKNLEVGFLKKKVSVEEKLKTVVRQYPPNSPDSVSALKQEEVLDKKSKLHEVEAKRKTRNYTTEVPIKLLKNEKSDDTINQRKHLTNMDSKNSDFLAPWPRASEPMSVKEMFALIRRSPRTGPGRRKSVGDLPVINITDFCPEEEVKKRGQKSAVGCSKSSRIQDEKANLSATVSRSSPTGSSLSLTQRTSRPGVDWSQNTDSKLVKL